jgi:hypothetical protein
LVEAADDGGFLLFGQAALRVTPLKRLPLVEATTPDRFNR